MSDTEEQYLLEAISQLKQEYHRLAKPYVDRLIAIRSMQPPHFIMPIEEVSKEFLDASLKK